MSDHVYFFGGGKADGHAGMKMVLGGKGANLAEMTNIGIPVPPGFTISTAVCTYFNEHHGSYPTSLPQEVDKALSKLEKLQGKGFGDPENPLLVSVRSGSAFSMPGMMDTILNLGLNTDTVRGLIIQSGNERFAWDCYRRFIQMYGDVVLGVPHAKFEIILEEAREKAGVESDADLPADSLKRVANRYLDLVKKETGEHFPMDPERQLWGAITAVFKSWNNKRAVEYRRLHQIPDHLGTAVNVQVMVFGNTGNESATGVAFTRNPASGENEFYGEFLINAQGEDVVAGIRTPKPMVELNDSMPQVYKQLENVRHKLESHYKNMEDLEFTIEHKKLYILQTRHGKRTGQAAIKIAVDMVNESLIEPKDAIRQVDPAILVHLLSPVFDLDEKEKALTEGRLLGKGLNAGPGAAAGKIVFTAEKAVEMAAKKEQVILVRTETSPEDIAGMNAARGILTSRGGMTSHAAVVARGMGKPCVVGFGEMDVDEEKRVAKIKGITLKEGDSISIDGTTGEILKGNIKTKPSEILQVLVHGTLKEEDAPLYQYYKTFMEWVKDNRRLNVRTNADTPYDSDVARRLGAEGIGLCRTEHMFFAEDRIQAVREMILSETTEDREKALAKIEPMQEEDFIGIFKAMDGLPVTIRLLDPPLHEFLPHEPEIVAKVAKEMKVKAEEVEAKVEQLAEMNPMLGHRGCRLGVTFPEIYAMQVRAIIRAACKVQKEGVAVLPEIMIPLVGIRNEFDVMAEMTRAVASQIMDEEQEKVAYLVGTMMEIPRACLVADQIARKAEFFSFGTNDLTQMTFGFSRDDINKFLPDYLDKGILLQDPFASLDQEGVGQLVEMGTTKGREGRENLKVGVCGEHGGDPHSVYFFHKVGLNYVSCSPYRVPVALLAAARAHCEES
ncbi:MAG TPA: pyruvate, phosphate dikinase [Thermoanaerobaculia bacterium]|nr:pyruvate, phosphate dikinase [Thermoanaerobaculia bacterium]HUM29005.1 pyruvate, phosphate dikinase [Thermoanaerobaculia bacterium]HXK67439.1 pyruvate, phosphate dikinase [Thermoanaerobaculia bacterium]